MTKLEFMNMVVEIYFTENCSAEDAILKAKKMISNNKKDKKKLTNAQKAQWTYLMIQRRKERKILLAKTEKFIKEVSDYD